MTDTPFPAAETGVAQEALRDAAEPSEQSMTEQSSPSSALRTSVHTDKFDVALAKAQVELENPAKTKTAKVKGVSKKTGKDFEMSYTYADIGDVLASARPILAKHGISITQVPMPRANMMMLVTRLSHAGQWIEGDYPVCQIAADHQQMGSALTYARRYALTAMIGVAAEDDDDGANAASPQRPAGNQQHQQQQREPDFPSAAAQYAADQLRQAKTKEEFTHFWEGQKTGLRETLDDGNFAHVIGVMRTEAKRFSDAPADKPASAETPFDRKEAA